MNLAIPNVSQKLNSFQLLGIYLVKVFELWLVFHEIE